MGRGFNADKNDVVLKSLSFARQGYLLLRLSIRGVFTVYIWDFLWFIYDSLHFSRLGYSRFGACQK